MHVGGQRHAPAALRPGKTRYLMYKRLSGPQAGVEGCGKSLYHRDSVPGPSNRYRSRYTH
jgi:hypothetical protein